MFEVRSKPNSSKQSKSGTIDRRLTRNLRFKLDSLWQKVALWSLNSNSPSAPAIIRLMMGVTAKGTSCPVWPYPMIPSFRPWLTLTAHPGLPLLFLAHLLYHVFVDLLLARPLLMSLDVAVLRQISSIVVHLLDDKRIDFVLCKRSRVCFHVGCRCNRSCVI